MVLRTSSERLKSCFVPLRIDASLHYAWLSKFLWVEFILEFPFSCVCTWWRRHGDIVSMKRFSFQADENILLFSFKYIERNFNVSLEKLNLKHSISLFLYETSQTNFLHASSELCRGQNNFNMKNNEEHCEIWMHGTAARGNGLNSFFTAQDIFTKYI